MSRSTFPWCLLLAALMAAVDARGGNQSNPAATTVMAGHADAPVRLDGRLDEPAWRQAGVIAELVQQSPHPGQPTPYRTEVRVLVVKDTLYFGFLSSDPEPGRIAVHTLQRDGNFMGDDTVSIVLDTYGDRRTGYLFVINAAGARADGLISDPEHPSLDWDGIWDARAARSEQGWSAEVEIPALTLNFTPGLKSWGLNLERFVARERITLRWASPTLDSFLYDFSRAGALTGVEDLKQGRGLEFSPFGVGRMKDVFAVSPRAWQGAEGFDLRWRMTPQMGAVFTLNTDFAETEVDLRQINITRFPLFFPEKRTFFLEGANQFEFGLGLGTNFIPFFTRRVGLLRGQPVPINAGLKLNGRAGKWNLALLDVETRETKRAPATNLLAGRVSYDLTEKFRLGTLFTNGDPEGRRSNTLVGLDGVWRTSTFRGNKNFLVGAWAAVSAGDLPEGRRAGWGFKVDYPNDLWDCFVTLRSFGGALTPALGFLPRPGTRQYQGGCSYKPRPSKSGPFAWIRQEKFQNYYTRVTNLNGTNESWQYSMVPVNIQLESGDSFEFKWEPQYEFLPAPFEIAPGVVIPPGSYRFTRWELDAETSQHRAWQLKCETRFGTFYNGHLTQWVNWLHWTSPRGRLRAGLAAENNFGRLRQASFVQRLWKLQFVYAWNPNLVLTSLVQYDTEAQNLGTNTRLRWTLKPGNDLFIVWNRGWRHLLTSPRDLTLVPETELLAVKLRWTFRW